MLIRQPQRHPLKKIKRINFSLVLNSDKKTVGRGRWRGVSTSQTIKPIPKGLDRSINKYALKGSVSRLSVYLLMGNGVLRLEDVWII